MNLNQAEVGKTYIVVFLNGGRGFNRGIRRIGIHVGCKLEVIAKQPLCGPIMVRVNDKFYVVIGYGQSENIEVEIHEKQKI
jgi:Fe2+ transport system protein FeoA